MTHDLSINFARLLRHTPERPWVKSMSHSSVNRSQYNITQSASYKRDWSGRQIGNIQSCTTQLLQQSAGQVTVTLASWAGMSAWKGPRVAEPVMDLLAQRPAMRAAEAGCRLSSCYSWQCQSRGHLLHRFPHRYTGSPSPCTGTSSPPNKSSTHSCYQQYQLNLLPTIVME